MHLIRCRKVYSQGSLKQRRSAQPLTKTKDSEFKHRLGLKKLSKIIAPHMQSYTKLFVFLPITFS